MKKSLSIILCVMMIAMTLCSCKFVKTTGGENKDTEGKSSTAAVNQAGADTEINGESDTDALSEEEFTVFVTDKNGEYITNKNGTKKTEVFNVAELEKQLEEELSKQEATASANTNNNSKSDTASSLIGDTQASKEDLLPAGQKVNDTTLMKTKIEPVLKSGTYTIKGSIKAEGQSLNTTVAFRNKAQEYSVIVALGAFSVKVFSVGGKYYMALPMFAKYAEVTQDEMGDMDEMTESFKPNDATYVKTTTVKDGKTTYTCEEYKTDTSTVKYYFNANKEWKRMEIIDGEDILVWEITSFSNKAEDSLFSAKGMIKDNSLLEGMY